jgi:hypothetical protein
MVGFSFGLRSQTEWATLAATLGFTPRVAQAGFGEDASFGQLRRALGGVAPPPPSFSHWLVGPWRGQTCFVVHYSVGSGSSRRTYTAAVTELTPPLLLCGSIHVDGSLQRFFGGPDIALGIPHVDEALRLKAADPRRMLELLAPRDHEDLQFLTNLATLVRAGLSVTDTRAIFRVDGLMVDPGNVRLALERVSWARDELGRRRVRMSVPREEQHVRAEWQRCAEERHLSFDPARMTLDGPVGNAKVTVSLETFGDRIGTAVEVQWPRSIGVGLHVRKSGALAFLTNLFGQDIITGDPAFDAAFTVQGNPEAWVQHALSNPELRDALRAAASAATDLTMTDHALAWTLPRPTLTSRGLVAHLDMAAHTSRVLFGSLESLGPYR